MAATLRCPNGHDWPSRIGAIADRLDTCPVCGAGPAADTAPFEAPVTQVVPRAVLPSETPTAGWTGSIPAFAASPVPGFEILGELGRGGMGVVFKAKQVNLHRVVALKMVLSGELASPTELARFRAEAEAAARLQHPNIVQLYEFGEARSADGTLLPYFALEFVNGGSLAERLDGTPQPARASAEIVESLARAMHYAHAQGVVHRDLKPGNILLQSAAGIGPSSVADDEKPTVPDYGVPATAFGLAKVTDFGLAKRMDSTQGQTQSGAILGTPQYMAPEQAAGRSKRVGPATDIYALGAILYELITGRPPFTGETPLETILMVSRDAPVPPRLLNPAVPRDLETITLKCLQKDPDRRYATAQALADDLRCQLADQPITARPAGPVERTRAWMRRHPTATALLAVTAVAAATLLFAGYHSHRTLRAAYAQVQDEKQAAHHRLVELTIANGARRADDGDLLLALPWYAEALRLEADDPGRAAVHRMRLAAALAECPMLAAVWAHTCRVTDATFRPDGKAAATAGDDGPVHVWDVANPDRPPRVFDHGTAVTHIEYRPDGGRLLVVGGTDVHLVDLSADPPRAVALHHSAAVNRAAWTSDGRRVVTAGADGVARVWDAETGRPTGVEVRHAGGVTAVAVSRDGARAATGGADGAVRVWEVATGKAVGEPILVGAPVKVVAFSPGGKQLLTAAGPTARLWDVASGQPESIELKHRQDLTDAVLSADGRLVATASLDDTGGVWDVDRREWADDPLKHGSDVLAIALSPDGKWAATASDDNTARVWDTRHGTPRTPSLPHSGTVVRAVFSPDGRRLLTAGGGGMAKLWDLPTAGTAALPGPLATTGPTEVRSRDGSLRITADGSTARVHDARTGAAVSPPLTHRGPVTSVGFSPDGTRVVTASSDRTARVWDSRTGQLVGRPLRHGSQVNDAVFSPDGARVVTGADDNTARVWDAATGEPVTAPLTFTGSVHAVRFSTDGHLVLTVGRGVFARAWDAAAGEAVALARRDAPWVTAALANPASTAAWDLPTDPRPVAALVALAEWLSGHRVDPSGGLVPLDTGDLRAAGAVAAGGR